MLVSSDALRILNSKWVHRYFKHNVVKWLLIKRKIRPHLHWSSYIFTALGEKHRKLWIQTDVLLWRSVNGSQPLQYICLLFYRNGSGGEPGSKEAVITVTAARKHIRRGIHFTRKHETQKPGSQWQHGVCFSFHLPHTHALNMVQQSRSPLTLGGLASQPLARTFPGEFRPGMCSWWRSNCNSWERKITF